MRKQARRGILGVCQGPLEAVLAEAIPQRRISPPLVCVRKRPALAAIPQEAVKMSATLVLINPNQPIAFVVADTRVNLHGTQLSDAGTHEITVAERVSFSIPSSRRKIRRCPFGWIAAAGHVFFISRAFESVASARITTEAKQLIDNEYHSVVDLAVELGEEAATVIAQFTLISSTADGFELDCIAFGRQCPSLDGTQFILSIPPELPPDVARQIQDQTRQRFNVGLTVGSIVSNVKLFASVFHAIHDHSQTVSDTIEVVVLLLRGGRLREQYGRGSCPQLMRWSPSELRGFLANL